MARTNMPIDGAQLPELNLREESALRAFEQQAVLRYHDLPVGVGSKTMRALIAKGPKLASNEGNNKNDPGSSANGGAATIRCVRQRHSSLTGL